MKTFKITDNNVEMDAEVSGEVIEFLEPTYTLLHIWKAAFYR